LALSNRSGLFRCCQAGAGVAACREIHARVPPHIATNLSNASSANGAALRRKEARTREPRASKATHARARPMQVL